MENVWKWSTYAYFNDSHYEPICQSSIEIQQKSPSNPFALSYKIVFVLSCHSNIFENFTQDFKTKWVLRFESFFCEI